MKLLQCSAWLVLSLNSLLANAKANAEPVTECVMRHFEDPRDQQMTLTELRKRCAKLPEAAQQVDPEQQIAATVDETPVHEKDIAVANVDSDNTDAPQVMGLGIVSERLFGESQTEYEPWVITPHRMNYILPAYATSQINKEPYIPIDGWAENLVDMESKFQLSLKAPLNEDDLFFKNDRLYLGFTLQAWWQVYSDNISKPFRESNYQPEIFYLAPLDWHPFGGNTGVVLGFEHQSNGRSQLLSRSWNRFYGHFLFEKDDFALSFKPWHRIKEDTKEFPLAPDGDDNPDIQDYMGRFELSMIYRFNEDVKLGFMGRQNSSTSRGALELGLTFPIWIKSLRGYATFFNGYGESLIDYNHNQTRFGVGISLNDIF